MPSVRSSLRRMFLPFSLLCTALFLLSGCQLLSKGGAALKPSVPQKKERCLVLALPASGPYAPIAAKIGRGARQAQQEMAATDVTIRLENIDTRASDWLTRLKALPEQCAVVGGPLQARDYTQARNSGALEQRAFFAFLPSLTQGDEGVRAWRFFPSREDQIDALIDFATEDLGIKSYGALYPTDNYGVRMTTLFEQDLAARDLPLYKAAYDPAAMDAWKDSAARLISPTENAGSSTPIPQTPFQAIFLPDSWKNMDMLTTSLQYNGEDRLVLLGTTLWEQSLNDRLVANAEKYALAVFPGAWSKTRAPKTLQTPGHDFWTALGYDFVHFGAGLDLQMRPSTPEITAKAARIGKAVRALAPLHWDGSGLAHQDLYIFQVSPTGKAELSLENFKKTRTAIIERTALRIQGLPAVDTQSQGSLQDGTLRPTAPVSPILQNTPQPSYKLRLPTQR